MSGLEVIESRPPRPRWWWAATATLVFGAVIATVAITRPGSHNTAEPSPAAEGYQHAGTVNGTTFWIILQGPNDLRLRTTGRLGGICNNEGPFDATAGPVPVCAQSIRKIGSVFVYVLPSATVPKTLSLSDGTIADVAGTIPLSQALVGKKLVVYVLPPADQIVSLAQSP